MAKANASLSDLNAIEYLMRPRVFDGHGYYDGLFRTRSTVKGKKLPAGLTEMTKVWYDQGLGRSICFFSKGDVGRAKQMISDFESARQPALWKGVGHAASYIGGCGEK